MGKAFGMVSHKIQSFIVKVKIIALGRQWYWIDSYEPRPLLQLT